MKPSDRELWNTDFLNGPFVAIPYEWLSRAAAVGLSADELVLLLHIYAARQVENIELLTPQELATRCGLPADDVIKHMEQLVTRGFLAIGERLDEAGTHINYFDLRPLWARLRGQDPLQSPVREWRKDVVTLFEEEFGRPLSGLECEQIRQWMERDGHAEWLIVEALREAVLANKYSFKYIDRVLYDWHRNRIRTKAELETYRQTYRERIKSRDEIAGRRDRPTRGDKPRDDRYAAFYQLFPDA